MKSEDIHLTDWARIFIGEVPGSFYIEVTIRTALVYLILMVSMRLMGKRMASQLGRNEMISMISLSAAIGVPIQSPDRGLLPAVIIAFIVVLTQQLIAKRATQNEKFETLTQGDISVLVEDGWLNLGIMKKTRLTRERVFGQLRKEGICHLGEVKRLYLEANGSFTFIESKDSISGLSILPDWDNDFKEKVCKDSDETVCNHCGNKRKDEKNAGEKCKKCGFDQWVKAVVS